MTTAVKDQEWKLRAACRDVDPQLFYPAHAGNADQIRRARRICGDCPVRPECLEFALALEAPLAPLHRHGIWAGTTSQQRTQILRCRTGQCQHHRHRKQKEK